MSNLDRYPSCSWLLLAAAAACAPPQSLGERDVELVSSGLVENCTECSKNAATVGDGIVFDQLHLEGLVNSTGVSIRGASICEKWPDEGRFTGPCLQETPLRLTVRNGVLKALRRRGGPADATAELPGNLLIRLAHIGGARYELMLGEKLWQSKFWVPEESAIFEYEFFYRMTRKHNRPPPPEVDDRIPVEPDFGSRRRICTGDFERSYFAVIYNGDWFDSTLKTVRNTTSSERDWFTLACNGTALAKMQFVRHTRGAARGTPQTEGDRQSFLKMYTADYCGTGHSFTENEHPLMYWDGNEGFATPGYPFGDHPEATGRVEAIWGPDGAYCVNVPRLASRDDVADHCEEVPRPLHWCPSFWETWENRGAGGDRVVAPGKPAVWPPPHVLISAHYPEP